MMNESCFAYIKYYQLTHAIFLKYPCSHFNEPLPPALHYGTHPCGPTKKDFGLIECKFAKLHVITQATKTSKYVWSAPNFTKKMWNWMDCLLLWIFDVRGSHAERAKNKFEKRSHLLVHNLFYFRDFYSYF